MTSEDFDPDAVDRALLRHHGDLDATPGLLDFAVNVRPGGPPRWLRDRLAAALDRIGRYPSPDEDAEARAAVAARHGRDPAEVLVLSGGAEGFALLPALRPRLAAVVHPSFTEPDIALDAAGVPVHRVLLDPDDGYRLRPGLLPEHADLVVIGNPTNPTSVLHPADVLRSLARPDRVLVVDEAFADAIPGEAESLASHRDVPGLLVLRSLTKSWALPGLRAGYALGAPDLLARLALHRPQWPIGTLVLEAVTACGTPEAVAEAATAAAALDLDRARLVTDLNQLPGVRVLAHPRAPFVLVHVADGARIRDGLRRRGIAVRRGDTFPGLDADHIRIAVRPPDQTAILLSALRAELIPEAA